jgi:hypothetical protein
MSKRVSKQVEKRIIAGLNRGETLRGVAQELGVHHKTVQNVGDRNAAYSFRSELFPGFGNSKTAVKLGLKALRS